jgi:hypothetical protein
MSRSRSNLEDLVGGLLDPGPGRGRRKATPLVSAAEPDRYPLTARGAVTIRATRAVDPPDQRADHAA